MALPGWPSTKKVKLTAGTVNGTMGPLQIPLHLKADTIMDLPAPDNANDDFQGVDGGVPDWLKWETSNSMLESWWNIGWESKTTIQDGALVVSPASPTDRGTVLLKARISGAFTVSVNAGIPNTSGNIYLQIGDSPADRIYLGFRGSTGKWVARKITAGAGDTETVSSKSNLSGALSVVRDNSGNVTFKVDGVVIATRTGFTIDALRVFIFADYVDVTLDNFQITADTITWPKYVEDSFGGNNGDIPDPRLWVDGGDPWALGGDTCLPFKIDDRLKIASIAAGVTYYLNKSVFVAPADFECQIDVDRSNIDSGGFFALYGWVDVSNRFAIYVEKTAIKAFSTINGSNSGVSQVSDSTDNVTLLVSRHGSVCSLSYNIGGEWVPIKSAIPCSAGNCAIVLYYQTGAQGSFVLLDNFQLTTDSIGWPAEAHNGSGITDYDLLGLFADIGANNKKIALEIGDTGNQVPIELLAADWDASNFEAVIYPIFPALTQADIFHLYWDSAAGDNSNVTTITTAPSAPVDTDELAVWNLAAADEFFTFSLGISLVRALFDQPYKMVDLLRQQFDQPYPMTEPFRAMFVQLWSHRILAMFRQYWGSMPKRRARFLQVWGAARRLRQMWVQEYGDKDKLIASFDQVFHLNGGLRAKHDQPWSVSQDAIKAMFDQVFALEDKSKQRAILHQLWVLAAGEAVVQKNEITVTAELDGVSRVLTSYFNINDEQDETIFYMTGELQLADQSEYLFCKHLRTRITVEVEGDVPIHYLVDEPTVSRNETGPVYVVPLKSETILLNHQESEYSTIEEQEFAGMRKELVEQLALHFSVDWRLKNTYLPPGILRVNGRTRMAIIEEIVDSLGGVVQTSPAGVLVCRKEYPKAVNTWQDAPPEVEFTDQDDAFRIVPQPSSRPGYNKYFISNSELSGDDLRKEEITISEREKLVRVYLVPWPDLKYVLSHSGGSWVKVINDGVKVEEVEEKIEIVLGEGQLPTKTCYGVVSVAWKERNLGKLQATEAGEVTTEIAENSMALVKWKTKYHQFRVITDRDEDVQVWPMPVQ